MLVRRQSFFWTFSYWRTVEKCLERALRIKMMPPDSDSDIREGKLKWANQEQLWPSITALITPQN